MSPADYGWLVLGVPAARDDRARARLARAPGPQRGLDRLGVDPRLVHLGARRAAAAPGAARRRSATSSRRCATTPTRSASRSTSGILVDPLSVLMILVVSGVSFLIHLYSVAYMAGDRGYVRFFAYLNFFVFSMLLLVLAGNFVLLIVGLGVRRRGVVPPDLVLVPARDGDRRRDQGVRDERDRRRRPGRRRVPAVRRDRRARLRRRLRGRAERVRRERRAARGGVHLPARRRVREVGADPAAHVAPGRDGGPDAGLRPDPRRDDGDRRRLPDRAHASRCSSSPRRPPTSPR